MLDHTDEDYPENMVEFEARFGSEEACRAYLLEQRWPDGFCCPKCGHDRAWIVEGRNLFHCAGCERQTSLTAGTVMHGTRKPLTTWFKAMWLITTRKTGISAKDLYRALGFGSYQTAWAWLQKLRRAMVRPEREPLTGVVEVDVTEVTCEDPKHYPARKVPVQVAVEDRGEHMGRVRLEVVDDRSAASLIPPLVETIEPGSTIHSDGWRGYNPVKKKGFTHDVDVIGKDRKQASTIFPNVHRVASLLKRFLFGTYQGAPRWFNLQHYLEEFTFRFNRRASRSVGKIFMRLVQGAARTGHTPYQGLTFDPFADQRPDVVGA